MTTGIYQIINLVNGNSYIGQSNQIEKRWSNHRIAATNINDKGYDYPLYRAFRKYGIENFKFQILEECTLEELSFKEQFWINKLSPEYNQTIGGESVIYAKLTLEQVRQIQHELQFNPNVNHTNLSQQYNVRLDTIRDINLGKTWHDSQLTYPLHISKYDASRHLKMKWYCKICGVEISKGSTTCIKHIDQSKKRKVERPSREVLKNLIRTKSFVDIARSYNNEITDNAIKKWCDSYKLPRTKREINSYSNEEWELI